MDAAILRAVDASANRALEGLRVVEDFLRFVLDDKFLTREAKELRHELAQVVAQLPTGELHAARETEADVGRAISTPSEARRDSAVNVCRASFQRTQQALRSLEEFAKLFDGVLAGQFETLRYRAYTLEKASSVTEESCRRLAAARVCILVDAGPSSVVFAERVAQLVAAGADIVQLRDKCADDRTLVERAKILVEQSRSGATISIINDRPDIAFIADADGVHIGQDDLPVKAARELMGPDRLIGVSTHSLAQARAAVVEGANYIGVGPTFPSTTKDFCHFPGLPLLRDVSLEITLPMFAIGGINAQNVRDVVARGIHRVAVGAAVTSSEHAGDAVRALRQQLGAANRD